MFRVDLKAWTNRPEFTESLVDLKRDTLRSLVLAFAAITIVGHFSLGLFQPEKISIDTWIITLAIGLTTWLSLSISKRHLYIASAIWLTGLVGSLLLTLDVYKSPGFVILFSLVPFLAVTTLGFWGGCVSEAAVIILMPLFTQGWLGIKLSASEGEAIILGGVIAGLIGWVAGRALITVTLWSLYGMEQARKNMEEARKHRAQLSVLLKDLDMAYYRLERTNSTLVSVYKQVDRAEQFKSEFIARVSHEMRTPLNLIVGFSELILSSPENYGGVQLPGSYRSDINSVYNNSRHLLSIVDDILDLARIEVGKIILTREQVNLATLVSEVASMMQDYLKAKNLDLQIHIEEDLPVIYIDRLRIRQVLLNLLVNAARFTERGYIQISVARTGGEIMIRVTDTGKGIAAKDVPRLFEEFGTSEAPSGSWHSGTGLGLPISKKFVELHRGQMGVESVPSQGTTFWFTLPCVEPTPDQAGEAASENKFLGSVREMVNNMPARQIAILVDENPRASSQLQHYLEDIKLIWAANFSEGVVKARENQAIALLTGAPHQLSELPPDLFFIQCPLPDYHQTTNALGVADFLLKPIETQELLEAVRRIRQDIQSILIVDDEPEMVKLIQRMLSSYLKSENCYEAYGGEDALRVIREMKPDLILLDLTMPGMDGYEILDKMKAEPDLASIPVIIISGQTQDSSDPLVGDFRVESKDGFTIGQIAQMVEASLNVLSQSWRPIDSTA